MSENKTDTHTKTDRRDNLSSSFSVENKTHDQADIDALNNRGTNATEYSTSFSKRQKENEQTSKITNKQSELEEKESLEDSKTENKKTEEKTELTKKEIRNTNIKSAIKEGIISQTPLGRLKEKILKLKITLIITGVLAILFVIMFLITSFIVIFDTYFNALSTYFAIPVTDSHDDMSLEDADGLLTNEDYLINPQTGENYTIEELVTTLKEDGTCQKITFWSGISDWFDGLDGKYGSICSYLRYIESYISEKEDEYKGLALDRSLIIGTIFYGYATQADYSQYEDATNVEDIIFGTEYYKALIDVLENGKITKDDLEAMIDNSILETSGTYYSWSVTDKKDVFGNVTSSVGKCTKEKNTASAKYSLKKWQIFMRFGEEAAKAYEKESLKDQNIISSDEECTGEISESELEERILTAGSSANIVIDDSVYKAINEMKQSDERTSISLFDQSAKTTGHEKDIFEDYTNGSIHIEFDYTNGFIYNNFPAFKESIEDNNINIEYDEAITPKEIESIIQLIIEKKTKLNEVLMFEDQDKDNYYGTYDGYSSVVIGAYCTDFLTSALDSINVQLKDCDGKKLKIVPFKEYIMGVAYGEVSDTEDDYVKAQMLAAISYALNRRNNYTKGNLITMRSGTCDQVFCEMDEGCSKKDSKIVCTKDGDKCESFYSGGGNYHSKASQSLINKYATFYEEVKDFLTIDKSKGKVADTSYVNLRQNEWEAKAKKGMNFTQIIQESYEESGKDYEVVRCSEQIVNENKEETEEIKKFGNVATTEYPEVSPDKGVFYGYSYNDEPDGKEITINPEWINNNITTISSNCEKGNWNIDYNVNKQASKNYQQAFSNICSILTKGVKISTGETCKYTIDDLQGGTTFAQRKTLSGIISDSSYGITQDWNYNKIMSINGKTYQPYGTDRSLEEYLLFVDALGGEEDCKNINYILYKYAYKDAGFQWGGNWGRNGNSGTFNGMHFYVNYE